MQESSKWTIAFVSRQLFAFLGKKDLPFSSTISLMRAIMHGKMGMQIDLLTLRVAAVSIWQSVEPFELFTNFFKKNFTKRGLFKN